MSMPIRLLCIYASFRVSMIAISSSPHFSCKLRSCSSPESILEIINVSALWKDFQIVM